MLRCIRCGRQYGEEYARTWGTTKETDGMGSSPICIELLEARGVPKARDGDGQVTDQPPLEMCKGQLMFTLEETTAAAPGTSSPRGSATRRR